MMTPIPYRAALAAFLGAALMAPLPASPVLAQVVVEPAIRVNDRAITDFEIEQRARLLAALGAGGDPTALARDQLIEERLKSQVIERLELEPTEEEVLQGMEEFAARRELEVGQMLVALENNGIAEETMRDFVRNGVGWRSAVQAIFRERARPSEQDLDTALDFGNRSVQEAVLLQELFIPIEERGEEETQALATRLSRELNRGGNFDGAVSRYSRSPTAARGGRLDWIPASQLPPAVAGQVLALMPGEVSAPVAVRGGFTIFKLRDLREERRPAEEVARDTITYFELIDPLPADASANQITRARERLAAVRRETRTCADLEDDVEAFGPGSGRSQPTAVAALPADVAASLADRQSGDIEILRDGRGVVLRMLCARAGEVSIEEREALRNRIFNERMATFAEGFIEELRGSAVIVER